MPKRRRSDDEGISRRRRRRRHHLHLVVDDWTKGYSIYKVDISDLDPAADADADLDSLATPLPGPPVLRLESCHAILSYPWFSSVGGNIAVMRYNEEEEDAPVLLYDTRTGGLAVGPRAPAQARFAHAFIPAGDRRLYMMSTYRSYRGDDRFEVLAATGATGRWAWSSVRTPPFSIGHVSCHAAHPDGRTIFFSVLGDGAGGGTYSFDTETQEWRRHGDWMLPFRSGQVYYDAELDAWVGLDGTGVGILDGVVRCCEVVSPTSGSGSGSGDEAGPPPAWKLAKEKLVCEDWERTNKVALTHMRPAGKFCLVEQRFRKGVNRDVGHSVYLFYATTFKLRYDKDGGLRATARRTRSYTMPHKSGGYHWSAFGSPF